MNGTVDLLPEEISAREALKVLAEKYSSLGYHRLAKSTMEERGLIRARAIIRRDAKKYNSIKDEPPF